VQIQSFEDRIKTMKNLAGVETCERDIEREIARSRMPPYRHSEVGGEVKTNLGGKVGSFTFRRDWTYWVASGKMPMPVAVQLYDDPVGHTDIRVEGDACGPTPVNAGKWFTGFGSRKPLPSSTTVAKPPLW
jgi:hypothetical protein